MASKIRWAGANAALGANPKVLVTQTLSLAGALSEFDVKYVAKGTSHFFGEENKKDLQPFIDNVEEILKHPTKNKHLIYLLTNLLISYQI